MIVGKQLVDPGIAVLPEVRRGGGSVIVAIDGIRLEQRRRHLVGHGIEVAARDYGHDLKAMLEAISDDTRVIFIANPNNPTGTLLGGNDLEHFLAQVPHTVLVVLDEAYTEYLPRDKFSDSIAWLKKFPNLAITRTFSKAYGLAGLRLGFSLAHPQVADLLLRQLCCGESGQRCRGQP